MPDILHFECERWKLTVWTRNQAAPKETLSAVLKARGRELPAEKICLSFSLTGRELCRFGDADLPAEPGSSYLAIPEPLCYENRDYEFEFIFKNGCKPDEKAPVVHRLSEVENCFRSVGKSTRGVVNFGNNVGWFKLGIRCRDKEHSHLDTISFRVFPTKMDMEEDLDKIGKVIDSIYPLWRFSLARKTDSDLSRSHKRHESFELLWIAQFKAAAKELADAGKLICRSPHSRLLSYTRYVKAERITGRITGKLEEQIKEDLIDKQHNRRYRIEKRKLSYDTPENRFVKMVLSYSVKKLKRFSSRVRELEKVPENARLSESFYDELKTLRSPFEKLSAEPLFRDIGSYDGRMRESLVLHQRTGYAKVYSLWQQLKLYLDFFGSDASISVRSVEQLYEIWCLLEIRRQLIKLGFEESDFPDGSLKTVGFEKNLQNADETFHLHRPDGMKAVLIHEPSYRNSDKSKFGKICSWTTAQRPDILLEVTLPSGDRIRWVFDAKYRIDGNDSKDWPQTGIDTVPDDAINQMHRYRDSLIYISKADEDGKTDKSRPVIGAFALYPGWFVDQSSAENPYKDSIEAVGIGAFPLLPGPENRWLVEFLKNQLGEYNKTSAHTVKEADEMLLQESVRIPPHGLNLYRHRDLILAADIYDSKGHSYVDPFRNGSAQWYHIPESTIRNYKISRYVMREMKYCAFTTTGGNGRVCRYVYPVESAALKRRSEINDYAGGPGKQKSGDSMYWLIKLGKSFAAPTTLYAKDKSRRFGLRLVPFQDFSKAGSWDDIPRKYLKDV